MCTQTDRQTHRQYSPHRGGPSAAYCLNGSSAWRGCHMCTQTDRHTHSTRPVVLAPVLHTVSVEVVLGEGVTCVHRQTDRQYSTCHAGPSAAYCLPGSSAWRGCHTCTQTDRHTVLTPSCWPQCHILSPWK